MNRNLSQNLENIKKRDSEAHESSKEKVVMNEDVAQSLRIALELL